MSGEVNQNKKLSWKRFIPMLLIMVLGIVWILSGKLNLEFLKNCICFIDNWYTQLIIYFLGLVIGFFHFIHITKDKQESRNIVVNTSIGYIDSFGSAIGYSIIATQGLKMAVGLLNEILKVKLFFHEAADVDYLTFGFVVITFMFIGFYKLYKMAVEAVFEIRHPFKDAVASNEVKIEAQTIIVEEKK
ncbi:MAG: hypothetical protein JSU07_12475 [Bacteroidetes bacterium]|nr:hypothetical protein [Bacteroidota bacterium]